MNCGMSLTRACANCATVLPLTARFCSNCGQPQDAIVTPDHAATDNASQPFSPQDLIARLDAARSGGGARVGDGERRVITMLFCDVQGSTAAASRLDPEDWSEIINGGFERMIRPIYHYDGTVARLLGDGLLAFFGAPVAHEDDPQRAILAGLAIVEGVRQYAVEVRREWGIDFNVRVGINTGEVVVGVVGSGRATEYTALGDPINLAARMEQTATPGTVQIAADTYRLVAPLFDFEEMGKIAVKGLDEPVPAWRVVGRRLRPGRLRGIAGLESPLVGREREIALIEQRLAAWRDGQGGILFLTGEAGLGKSRLITEAHQRAADMVPGYEWRETASLSYETGQPYGLIQRLFRRLCAAAADDDPAQLQACLAAELALTLGSGESTDAVLDLLIQMFLGDTHDEQPHLEGELFRNKLQEAVAEFWRQRAAKAPVILVFDDLHWTDTASVELLRTLYAVSAEGSLLLIGALRPDKQSAGWEALEAARNDYPSMVTEIAVSPLSMDQSGDLMQRLFRQVNWPPNMQKRVVERAGGNPFFLEELIRSLVESGAIVRDPDERWVVSENSADADLPDTLQGLLQARIDRLEAESRDTLQMASVIGRSFYYRVLAELSQAVVRLERSVDDLTEADMIREISHSHELEYMFTHALTQQAAYHSILLRKRREYHQRVGEALERLYAPRLEELSPILAQHFDLARNTPKAAHYYHMAGDAAYHVYANTEAAEHYGRALNLLLALSDQTATIQTLFIRRGRTLELLARYEEALQLYEELETWAAGTGQTDLVLKSLLARITIRATANPYHDPTEAQRLLARARALSVETGDAASEARILWNMLLLASVGAVRFPNVQGLVDDGLAIARAAGLKEQEALFLFDSWYYYGTTGQWEKGRDNLTLALGLWRELDNMPLLSETYGRMSFTDWYLANYDQALSHSAAGVDIARKSHNAEAHSVSLSSSAPILFDRGELQQALEAMEEAVALGHSIGGVTAIAGTQAELGYLKAWLGDPSNEGLALATQAHEWVSQRMAQITGFALVPLARIHLLQGEIDQAQAAIDRLISVRHQQQSVGFIAHVWIGCSVVSSEAALREGKPQEALAIARSAREDMEAAGLRYFLPDLQLLEAQALFDLGRTVEGTAALWAAEQSAQSIGSRRSLWEIYAVWAAAEAAQGNDEAANAYGQAAWQVIETMVATLESPAYRASLRRQVVARRPVLSQYSDVPSVRQET